MDTPLSGQAGMFDGRIFMNPPNQGELQALTSLRPSPRFTLSMMENLENICSLLRVFIFSASLFKPSLLHIEACCCAASPCPCLKRTFVSIWHRASLSGLSTSCSTDVWVPSRLMRKADDKVSACHASGNAWKQDRIMRICRPNHLPPVSHHNLGTLKGLEPMGSRCRMLRY